jgi:hypothetical protein
VIPDVVPIPVEDVKDCLRLRSHHYDLHPAVAVEVVDDQLARNRFTRAILK